MISSLDSLAEGVDHFDIVQTTEVIFKVRSLSLLPGTYRAGIALYAWGEQEPRLSHDTCLTFDVVAATVNNAYWPYGRQHGLVRLSHDAEIRVQN